MPGTLWSLFHIASRAPATLYLRMKYALAF
uniref:Uncharacterized protein n=1 Tax=Anguilla anguilla TaxID=7936 RepID=A0A0E9QIB4_ANGAN